VSARSARGLRGVVFLLEIESAFAGDCYLGLCGDLGMFLLVAFISDLEIGCLLPLYVLCFLRSFEF